MATLQSSGFAVIVSPCGRWGYYCTYHLAAVVLNFGRLAYLVAVIPF